MAELHDASVPRSSKSSGNTEDGSTGTSSSDGEDGSTGTSSSDGHKSLLDVLKSPQRSEFARKRSIAQNLPHDGRRHKLPKRTHGPKGITPGQSVNEFPQ